ncbi:MAG: DUF11 domain-containing protein [Chloroflexi bacterium]|nr:DUF11 domain-containing protein [Chloroflexota bacterium]MBU1752045.1 DUF11 domain-containing protein [Chloroflexota bacterium]
MTHPLRWTSALLIVLALLAGMMPVSSVAQSPGPTHYLVRVTYATPADLQDLTGRLDVWEVHPADARIPESYLVAWVSAGELADLQATGLKLEVLPDPRGGLETIPGYPCYRTIDELYAALGQIAADHPGLTELLDVGNSWDKQTVGGPAGYDLLVLKITNEAIPGPKPRFFLMANIHGRELITPETAMAFVDYLIDNYGQDPDVTWVVDNREILVLVSANPDGHVKNEAGSPWAYWRKNTNSTQCSGGDYGVDLNRNASFKWGCCGGSSGDTCDETYRGTAPASEPEEQAIEAYVRSIFPDQRGPNDTDPAPDTTTGILVTLHSYSNLVLWPWGHTSSPAPNSAGLSAIGTKFATWNGYTPQQSMSLYATDGTTDDWSYGELGVPSFTFEMGSSSDGFYPSCSRYDGLIQPNLPAFFYAAKIAQTPYRTAFGPDADAVQANPGAVSPGDAATLTATIDDGQNGSQSITAAEYFIDTPGAEGTGAPMTAVDGTFNSASEGVTAPVDTTGLTAGKHLLLVRGRDSAGYWGPFTAAFLYVLSGNEGVLQGTVTDAVTGMPLAATVQLSPGGWGTATDPATGAYRFTLPADTYVATATAAGHRAATASGLVVTDGVTVTQDFALEPTPPILLVDDDNASSTDYRPWYTAALDALGEQYDTWTVASKGSPTAADLAAYRVLIWFTGKDYTTSLTSAEQTALAAFLDGGGNLFLTGQDIGYDIGTSAFYANYLHATYISDNTGITALIGSDLFAGQTIGISGGDGANNQAYPSEIAARDAAATLVWTYQSSSKVGALKVEGGAYKLLYFAFGFEGINAAAARRAVMETALDYVAEGPAMSIAKTASSNPVAPGDLLTYTITIQNLMATPLSAMTITDAVPAHTVFASATPTATLESGVVKWEGDAIPAWHSLDLTMAVTVGQVASGTLITNDAYGAWSIEVTTPTYGAPVTVQVQHPALRVSKTASADVVAPGAQLAYTLTVTNDGPVPAAGVTITDAVPAHATFAASDGSYAVGVVSWPGLTLGPGASLDVTFAVTVGQAASGTLITNDDYAAWCAVVPTPVHGAPVVTSVQYPALRVSKRVSVDWVGPGQWLIYTLHVVNDGPVPAAGIAITDTVPAHTAFADSTGSYADGVVSWAGLGLNPGASLDATFAVTVGQVASGTLIVNDDYAAWCTLVPTPVHGAPVTTRVQHPVLRVTKTTSADVVAPGARLGYTIHVVNDGLVPAGGVTITDAVPAHTTFAASDGNYAAGVVSWPDRTLGPGGSLDLTMAVTVGQVVSGTLVVNDNYGTWCTLVPTPVHGAPVTTLVQEIEWYWLYLPLVLREQ